jgi:hypothetical protein
MTAALKTIGFLTCAIAGLGSARATTISANSGSLGAAANGTNSDGISLGTASPLAAAGDKSAGYGGGAVATPVNTTVQYNAALNPAATSSFSIEFWVNPNQDIDNGWAPVFNRISAAPRTGWTFFQRGSAAGASGGWNFAFYAGGGGSGTSVGSQITGGGTSFAVGQWQHVVGVWNGTTQTPSLYVNGVSVGSATGSGYVANASTSAAVLSVGSYANGDNSFQGGLVDETAFYNKALTGAEIAAHYAAAANTTPGVYSGLVIGDGALLYLQNSPVPEPAIASLAVIGMLAGFKRRR